MIRWDWLSDGTCGTNGSYDMTAEHTFAGRSGCNFTVEVMDTDGLTTRMSREMSAHTSSILGPEIIIVAALSGAVVAVALLLILRRRKMTEPLSRKTYASR